MKALELTGKRFGRLLVIERRTNKTERIIWACRCDCGATIEVSRSNLRSGHTMSCGCLVRELLSKRQKTHGASAGGKRSKAYSVWLGMRHRCSRTAQPKYQRDYVARGIKVCERWQWFENFLTDMGEPPDPAMQIDRIDNNGDYEPGNCRWANFKEQARNRRSNRMVTINGVTMCLSEWCERQDLPWDRVWARITQYGWTPERALEIRTEAEAVADLLEQEEHGR